MQMPNHRRAGKITATEIAPVISVRGPDEIDAAFAAMKKAGADAVVVQDSFSTKNDLKISKTFLQRADRVID
jgi:hypothetical protein